MCSAVNNQSYAAHFCLGAAASSDTQGAVASKAIRSFSSSCIHPSSHSLSPESLVHLLILFVFHGLSACRCANIKLCVAYLKLLMRAYLQPFGTAACSVHAKLLCNAVLGTGCCRLHTVQQEPELGFHPIACNDRAVKHSHKGACIKGGQSCSCTSLLGICRVLPGSKSAD